jgi:hypothetical protein
MFTKLISHIIELYNKLNYGNMVYTKIYIIIIEINSTNLIIYLKIIFF